MRTCVVLLLQILSISNLIYAWFPSNYPAYCAKNISTQKIPPLTSAQKNLVHSLKQVQIIVRHGARTPYALLQCWKNYNVTWSNCNVTELMIPSPTYTAPNPPGPWLFRKIYDGSANYLGGNCLTGQLISEGYFQEQSIGNYLNDAYLKGPYKLFTTDKWTSINTEKEIYLRSDDQQRTLESGQIILHTMFNVSNEVIVPWHTGDYDLDQIYPNSQVCPILNTFSNIAYSSSDYQSFNNSNEVKNLVNDLNIIFGGAAFWSWEPSFDCLLTTVCTDRQVPYGDPAIGVVMNDAIFNATLSYSETTYAYNALYNDSIWSKYALGNIAWHVRNNLLGALNKSDTNALKLAMFTGHDTTIMPFLAAVLGQNWDKKWAGYGALVTIELYNSSTNSSTSADLFRIVYNGVPQTVPGCTDTLCSVEVLLNQLAFGKETMPCAVSSYSTTTTTTTSSSSSCIDSGGLDSLGWSMIVIASLLFGALLGSASVVFITKYHLQDSSGETELSNLRSNPA